MDQIIQIQAITVDGYPCLYGLSKSGKIYQLSNWDKEKNEFVKDSHWELTVDSPKHWKGNVNEGS